MVQILKTKASPSFPRRVISWFDSYAQAEIEKDQADRNRWVWPVPFMILSLSVFTVFLVGFSWTAFAVAVFMYAIRMFGITGVYHRYLSHKTYKTSRWFQYVLAVLGNSATQRGPIWWAAHHRHHHRFSDDIQDIHSPRHTGFWNSHMLWWSRRKNVATRSELAPDLTKFPELVFLDRFDALVPALFGTSMVALGMFLHRFFPALGTNGPQMFVWGFCISTVVLFHGVATINSLSHVFGTRRFETTDTSRNNFLLAIITLGEGWHNNHHHYCNSTRQGFVWWEIDITYYGLKLLEKMGLVWDLKPVPARVMQGTIAKNKMKIAVERPHEVVPQPQGIEEKISQN